MTRTVLPILFVILLFIILPVSAQENAPLLIRVNGKAGFIDRTGKVAIEPQFEDAENFSHGLAPVKLNGKWGFVNLDGKIVIEPRFTSIFWHWLSDGVVPVGIDGKMGAIDMEGKFVIAPTFGLVKRFSDGLIPVRTEENPSWGEKWIYVDKTGKRAVDKEFFGADSFVDGRAFVKVGFDEWALIDKTGREVTKRHFDSNDPWDVFAEGLQAVKIKKKWGYIDRDGKIIIKPRFDDADNFSEGLAVVQVGCLYGYINKSGKFVIAPNFEKASDFSEGLASVAPTDGKYERRERVGAKEYSMCGAGLGSNASEGYIDRTGKMIISPQFGRGFPFSGGVAMVSFGEPPDVLGSIGKRGYIGRNGKYIWEPTE